MLKEKKAFCESTEVYTKIFFLFRSICVERKYFREQKADRAAILKIHHIFLYSKNFLFFGEYSLGTLHILDGVA